MLWEIEIRPAERHPDREGERVLAELKDFDGASVRTVKSARSFLVEGNLEKADAQNAAERLLVDPVMEELRVHRPNGSSSNDGSEKGFHLLNVLYQPGVTDNVGGSTQTALSELGFDVENVATCRKYWIDDDVSQDDLELLERKILANEAIERVVHGPLEVDSIGMGSPYTFELKSIPIRQMDAEQLQQLSKTGQFYLNLVEMQTIQRFFLEEDRDPTDIELETIAQTWSEHCSHKTLAGRIGYRDENGERQFENMLKETIFAATQTIRKELGSEDWCVSVFEDNAGIVKFDEKQNVCFKVETHNHPSALEPYGGANTGIGGVIRDPLGTGLGAKAVCNTDVFCFAPVDTPAEELPPGVLHPKIVAKGVIAGVSDYGNRMGIPTVNGAVLFDQRYVGNPLVYCGNVAMIPVDKCEKRLQPGDYIVAVGGKTGRDGIHGATFSSAELSEESEMLSGGAVQIGNAITEKMLLDVIVEARDRNLYSSITDCGAGGFSSAIGEMGAKSGAEVWLEKAPLKYEGLSYTEIWISEAQERMVLAVPPKHWDEFHALCKSEDVEATVIGKFTDTERLVLKYNDTQVADLSMQFLHNGRPPVIRNAVFEPAEEKKSLSRDGKPVPSKNNYNDDLKNILASPNVASKEWIVRQYDHEVQSGSVVKPLVGESSDGPSDASVVRPDLNSNRGLVVSNGINPCYGDLDPYWMAASAIDEALRNCVAVGANPDRIAILDNFCWGNTDRPETLGTLVRAALACHDLAVVLRTPFISGKDSLNNEFSFLDAHGESQTIVIPSTLLISALGQIDDVENSVTMDLKQPGNLIYLIGETKDEMGGSHFTLVNNLEGGCVPKVEAEFARNVFLTLHRTIRSRLIRSCHDLSEGGLAVTAAEMSFAGEFGMELDLGNMLENSSLEDYVLLFSESNTRFLVEVEPEHRADFESLWNELPCQLLGKVSDRNRVTIQNGDKKTLIDTPWEKLKTAWQATLNWG